MTVQVKELSDSDFSKLKEHTLAKIKSFVLAGNKRDENFWFYPARLSLMPLKLPEKFLEYKVVCMKCGHVEDMANYAIAQCASGNMVTYTCNCNHTTTLPQFWA